MTKNRSRAAHGLAFLAGGIAGALLWKRHWIWGFVLGSSAGWAGATLITGDNPFEAPDEHERAAATVNSTSRMGARVTLGGGST